jgi:hypothetical protein
MLTYVPGVGQKFAYDISAGSAEEAEKTAGKGATVMQVYEYNPQGLLTKNGIF